MDFAKMAQVESSELFENGTTAADSNRNWRYCVEYAPFVHREACDFIFFCDNREYVAEQVKRMRRNHCTREFIDTFIQAHRAGADFINYWC